MKHTAILQVGPDVTYRDGQVTVEATPEQLAAAFSYLSDEDQAQFFIAVAEVAKCWPPGNMDQWCAVGRHLATCECSTVEARDLVRRIAFCIGPEDDIGKVRP